MNQWPFVVAAYHIVGIGTLGLLCASVVGMKRDERRTDRMDEAQ